MFLYTSLCVYTYSFADVASGANFTSHYIPQDDEHWLNFLALLQIMNFLLCPLITTDEVAYLQLLIDQHHQAFCNLYPGNTRTPKMHYIVHMPRILIQ